MKTITIELRPEDAEPILRRAAFDAAFYEARWLYITKRTVNAPSRLPGHFDEQSKDWHRKALISQRVVEAFGIEHEPTSEGETLTVHWPEKVIKSKIETVGRLRFRRILESKPDPKNAMPEYRRGVHEEACHQAADRVVRKWRAKIDSEQVAA